MDKQYASPSKSPLMAAGQGLPPASCFTRLQDSISQLRLIRNRVGVLADTLAGVAPETGCATDGKQAASNGLFDSIDTGSSDICELCSQIASSLTRIESRL